jgi:hypothetical protein
MEEVQSQGVEISDHTDPSHVVVTSSQGEAQHPQALEEGKLKQAFGTKYSPLSP